MLSLLSCIRLRRSCVLVGGMVLCLALTVAVDALPTHDTHDFFAIYLEPSATPIDIARRLDAQWVGPIGELADHHKFAVSKGHGQAVGLKLNHLRIQAQHPISLQKRDLKPRETLDGIAWFQRLQPNTSFQKRETPPLTAVDTSTWVEDAEALVAQQQLMSSLGITDPGFAQQWHLFNTIQPGQDMNVTGIWLEGITGRGVVTAIIDNGLDTSSNDLASNYFSEGSYDFNDHKQDPTPRLGRETHGTWCAGEVAAGKNGICGLGMAYESKVAGIRLLSGPIDESDEAAAINYKFHDNHIFSCSWGPPDTGAAMGGPGPLFRRALMNGVQDGRHGKGSIYVFAAGNGGFLGDNCNFDGYTNSIYTITIGAVTREGRHAEYTEPCAAQLAVAYSSAAYKSDGLDAIYTTDIGSDSCTHAHGGTSAAGPLAAGAVALALSVRPELTWRDVQYLLRETAVPMETGNTSDWQTSRTGRIFSHLYGFGKVDTYGLVQRAKDWPLVKSQALYHAPCMEVNADIPQGAIGVSSSLEVTQAAMHAANLARIEHVTVTMNVNHTRRGDLSVDLYSPDGMVSYLSTSRKHDDEPEGYKDWTFSTVAHWGESGVGIWEIVVKDSQVNEFKGTFIDWQLTLWGEAIIAESQALHPLADFDHHEDKVASEAMGAIHNEAGFKTLSTSHGSFTLSNLLASQPWWIWTYGALLVALCVTLALRGCWTCLISDRYRHKDDGGQDMLLKEMRPYKIAP